MKKICLLYILLTALCACTSVSIDTELSTIEAVMPLRPDSALTMLQAIDSRRLSRADNARYALLLTQAKDKCFIDETNDSLINIAVKYYRHSKHAQSQFLAYYYQGRVLQNAHKYHEALQAFTHAEQLINDIDNDYAKGLLYTYFGHLYLTSYDFTKALDAYVTSHQYYLHGNVTTHIPHALLNIGNTHLAMQQNDTAAQYIYEAIKGYEMLGNTPKCNEAITLLTDLYIYEHNYTALDSLLNSHYCNKYPHNTHYYIAQANLHRSKGNFNSANHCLQQAFHLSSTLNDTIDTHYNKYLTEKAQQNFKQAFLALEKLYFIQDSIVRVKLQQPLITAQRDYYSQLAETKSVQYKNSQQRQLLLLLATIIAILIIVIGIIAFRHYSAAKEAALAHYINAVHDLKQAITNKTDYIDEMSSQINILFSQLYKALDEQCAAYYECQDMPQKEKYVYKQLYQNIELLNSDAHLHAELEGIINKYRNNAMTLARKHITHFKEKDFQLLMYIYAGFSAKSISVIMGTSIQNIYTRKSRIKNCINELPTDISNILLQYIP